MNYLLHVLPAHLLDLRDTIFICQWVVLVLQYMLSAGVHSLYDSHTPCSDPFPVVMLIYIRSLLIAAVALIPVSRDGLRLVLRVYPNIAGQC